MARYRATLAYDGSSFQGFQRQRDGTPTVQGTVEAALRAIVRQDVTVIGAGRTDTGVHATGQVIAFDLGWTHGERALYQAINANLPDAVAVVNLAQAEADFHPRYHALRRQYQYTLILADHPLPLQRHTAWIVQRGHLRHVDAHAMVAAAGRLVGRRDFGALGTPPQGTNTVRQVFRSVWAHTAQDGGTRWVYTIEADAFLYRMVRRTVGMLYDVLRGRLSEAAFAKLLDAGEVARGVTIAPPQGLALTRVWYPGELTDNNDNEADRQTRPSPQSTSED